MLDNLQTMWENFIDCGSAPLAKRPKNTTPFDLTIRRSCSFFLRELVPVCFRKEAWSCQRRLLWENIHFFTPENLQSGLKVQVYEKPWGNKTLLDMCSQIPGKFMLPSTLTQAGSSVAAFSHSWCPSLVFLSRVLASGRTWMTPMYSL